MSLSRHVLNLWLRLTEKRWLARVQDPAELRRAFEAKARFWLRAPRGSRFDAERRGDVPVVWVRGPEVARDRGPVMVYFHGGGYVFGSPATHRAMMARLSALTGLPACLPTYRKAPEHAFPAAVEDGLAVLRALGDHPGGVILGGDSSGGGLALAVLGEALRQHQPLPRALFAFSALTDLGFSGKSLATNARAEAMLPVSRTDDLAQMYLQGADPDDPRASPLRADFTGAPPVWLSVGDTEILLDDTRRMTLRLTGQGVTVTEVIAHDLPHVWPLFPGLLLPEAEETLRGLAGWIKALSPLQGEN